MADRIQLRRDTAANWTQYNPILLEGEPGIELDTDQWKLGDGIHTWSQLAYRGGECVQQTGQSTTVAMSQKAVTDELNSIIDDISDSYGYLGATGWVTQNKVFFSIDRSKPKPSVIKRIKFKYGNSDSIRFWKVTVTQTRVLPPVAITDAMTFTDTGEKIISVNVELGENEYIGVSGYFAYQGSGAPNTSGYSAVEFEGKDISGGDAGFSTKQALGFQIFSLKSDFNAKGIAENAAAIQQNKLDIENKEKEIENIEKEILIDNYGYLGVASGDIYQNKVFFACDRSRTKPTEIKGIKFKHRSNASIRFWKVTIVEGYGTPTAITDELTYSEEGINVVLVNVSLAENEYIGVSGTFFYQGSNAPYDSGYLAVNFEGGEVDVDSFTHRQALGYQLMVNGIEVNAANIAQNTEDIQQNTEDIFTNSQIELKKYIDTLLDLQNIEHVDWDKYTVNVDHPEGIYLNLMRHSGKTITDIYYKTLGGETVFYLVTTENGVYTNIEELQTNVVDVRESPFIAHCKLDTPVVLADGQYIAIQYSFYYSNDTVDDKAYNSAKIGGSVNYQKNSEIGYVVVDETLQGKSLIKDDALNLLSPADFIKNGGCVDADGSIQSSNVLKNTGLVDVSSLYRVVASFQTQGIDENHRPAIILYDEHYDVVKVYYAYAWKRNCLFDIFLDKHVKYMLINVYYNVNGADYTTYTCYGYKRIHVTKQQNVLYRKKFNSTVIYPEYTNATAANFTDNGLLINSSTPIQLQKYYSLHTRTLRLLCKFSDSTVAKIASNDGYSYITIDGTAATITMHATTPITKNLSFYNSSHLYVIEITRNYEKNICTITDLNTSDSETIEHVENGTGGTGQGSVGVVESAGAWHDYYQFSATSGSFYIKELSISPLYGKVKTLIYGDSVTELLYYPQADYMKCWTQQFIAACVDRVMVSPRGGTSIGEILMRIPNELPYIDAEYVMITIGTNSGVSLESFSQLVEYIFKCGATPVLNHIPCNINSGGVSNHVEINAMIDQIREKYGIHGVDFDIATSVNLDGQTVDTTKMYWEDYAQPTGSVYHHPNVKGSTAMMQQIKLDMPELLI